MNEEGQPSQSTETTPIEAPRTICHSRVDEKGRLKLPADIKEYLASFNDKRLFVTSLDLRVIRVYPMKTWRDNENFLDGVTENSAAAEDIAFLAQDNGDVVEIDNQSRILLPAQLRREMSLENEPVWMQCYKGRINIFGKDIYEQRRSRARDRAEEKVRALEEKGFK